MGKLEEQLVQRLEDVLDRLDKAVPRLRKDKCQFGVSSVQFQGFKIDDMGILPSIEKVKAISEAPAPKDKKQLKAFLGLLNFSTFFAARGNTSGTITPFIRQK